VVVNGVEWGALPALEFHEAGKLDGEGVAEWGKRVVRELLECIRRGDDVWSRSALDGRYDLLRRCLEM
jgi:hypothetical protein